MSVTPSVARISLRFLTIFVGLVRVICGVGIAYPPLLLAVSFIHRAVIFRIRFAVTVSVSPSAVLRFRATPLVSRTPLAVLLSMAGSSVALRRSRPRPPLVPLAPLRMSARIRQVGLRRFLTTVASVMSRAVAVVTIVIAVVGSTFVLVWTLPNPLLFPLPLRRS